MKKIILSMLLTLIMHFNLPASKEIIDNKLQNTIDYLKNAQKINSKKAWFGPFFRNPAKETNEIQKKIFQFILITGTVYFIFALIPNNKNILDPQAELPNRPTIIQKIRQCNFVDFRSDLKDFFLKIHLKNLTIISTISYLLIVSENQQEITNHNDTKELADEYEKTITSNLQDYQAKVYTLAGYKHDLNDNLEKTKTENISLQNQLGILEKELSLQEEKNKNLNSTLKKKEIELETQTTNANLTQTKNGELMEENKELQKTLLITRENLAELQNHCDKNDMAIKDLRSQSTTTKLENEKLQSNLILLKEEIKNKNEQLTNKQVFLKKENPTVSQLQDEKIQGLQSQLKILQKEIENLREQLKERPQREIFEIPTELKIEPEETTTLKNENDELKIKIAALQQTLNNFKFNKYCKEHNIVFQKLPTQNPNRIKKNHKNR